jgi:dTDP-4-dehydrorhamnose 3,5-epimerase
MGAITVNDIIVTPLKRISVAGGDVLHAIKKTDAGFLDFGEAYFSMIHKEAIKPWKRHLNMTLNLVVPVGNVKFLFIDTDGESRYELIGTERYARLTVPPSIWFSFQGLSEPFSLLLNVADIPHDPNEIERKDLNEFANDWNKE